MNRSPYRLRWLSCLLATSLLLGACAATPSSADLGRIQHVVVIYAENRGFDHLYGLFPGANGLDHATPEQMTQLDHDGKPLPALQLLDHGEPDPSYPPLPNRPFRIDAPPVNRSPAVMAPNPIHAYYHNQEQINGGKNNMFAAMSNVGGWAMGHYDGSQLKLWQWAKDYTLADNFFMAAFGGSYLNHQWLICACTPQHANAPASMRARLTSDGKLEKRPDSPSATKGGVKVYSAGGGQVTPDGWSVNTSQPPYQPSGIAPAPDGPLTLVDPKGNAQGGEPVPPQTSKTIGDTLSAKGVSWAWYAGGWNAALSDGMQVPAAKRKVIYQRGEGSLVFQPHHQPFNYFARYAPGTAERARHLKDGEDFLADMAAGRLPAVSFYKPVGLDNQHPGYSTVARGDAHVASILDKLKASPQWKDMLVIVTYDENGGFWDHVAPPRGEGWSDRWGPGSRVPTLLIGPHVKRGHIDSTPYDTTSILKFITRRFELEPLPGVRAKVGDLSAALQ